jgi:hypothetical protein
MPSDGAPSVALSPSGASSSHPPPPEGGGPPPSASAPPPARDTVGTTPTASGDSGQSNAGAQSEGTEPPLVDAQGKPLPQTEDRPRVDTASFRRRMERLVQAIAQDDPSLARSSFFPVVAYEQVKAVAKPARDWEYRLIRAFERDIHEYHRALGRDAGGASFESIEVPEQSARWMKPGSEGNRLGYFRVLRSRLRIKKADKTSHTFEVTSMISWRGEWYVVHLHGFE